MYYCVDEWVAKEVMQGLADEISFMKDGKFFFFYRISSINGGSDLERCLVYDFKTYVKGDVFGFDDNMSIEELVKIGTDDIAKNLSDATGKDICVEVSLFDGDGAEIASASSVGKDA